MVRRVNRTATVDLCQYVDPKLRDRLMREPNVRVRVQFTEPATGEQAFIWLTAQDVGEGKQLTFAWDDSSPAAAKLRTMFVHGHGLRVDGVDHIRPKGGVLPRVSGSSKRSRVLRPAGFVATRMLHWVFSPKTCERIFDQGVADMRDETIADLHAGRLAHARWVILRGHLALLLAVCVYVTTYFAKRFAAIWKLVGG